MIAFFEELIWPVTVIIVVAIAGGIWLEGQTRKHELPRRGNPQDKNGEEKPGQWT